MGGHLEMKAQRIQGVAVGGEGGGGGWGVARLA